MSTAFPDAPRQDLDALYRNHHGWLRGWLRLRLNNSADAADLAQDTFVRVLLARTAGTLHEAPGSRLDALPAAGRGMKVILAQAVDWYMRLHDSSATEATRADWQAWLAANPQHAQAWARLERLQQRLGEAPAGVAATTLEQARRQRRHALRMLAVLLGGGVVGWQGYRVSPWNADYATRVGERRHLTLAYGSRLTSIPIHGSMCNSTASNG